MSVLLWRVKSRIQTKLLGPEIVLQAHMQILYPQTGAHSNYVQVYIVCTGF